MPFVGFSGLVFVWVLVFVVVPVLVFGYILVLAVILFCLCYFGLFC